VPRKLCELAQVPGEQAEVQEREEGDAGPCGGDHRLRGGATGGPGGHDVLEDRHRLARMRHPEHQVEEEGDGDAAGAEGGEEVERRVTLAEIVRQVNGHDGLR
jgi:hypothetical protein